MKKVLLLVGALAIAIATVPLFAAFEAHVINVTAHIENALYVHPDEIAFGTVFPQEYVERDFTVELSSSFQKASRVDGVEYVIKQKPKCECDDWNTEDPTGSAVACPDGRYQPVNYATHECPEGYSEMENLCQFLSKVDGDPDDSNDTSHPSYYIDPTPASPNSGDEYCQQPTRYTSPTMNFSSTGWGGWSCPAGTRVVGGGHTGILPVAISKAANPADPQYPVYPHYIYTPPEEGWVVQNGGTPQSMEIYVDCLAINPDATGKLTKNGGDILDLWKVDLKVPPVAGYVGQDWPAGCPTVPTNDVDYGCDLWIEVTSISTP